MKRLLTARSIAALKPGSARYYVSDTGGSTRGNGTLLLAIDPSGRRSWIFRYSVGEAKTRLKLGLYGDGEGYLSLEQARKRAGELSGIHDEHRDVRAFIDRQKKREQAEQRAREKAQATAAEHTLEKLCNLYVDRLQAAGKGAARDAANVFKNWVFQTEYASLPAAQLSSEDIADLLRPLSAARKLRSSGKLRSYLRSAYQTAVKARSDGSIPIEWKAFNVRANPVADVPTLGKARTLNRTLNDGELAAYLKRVRALESVVRGPLLLASLWAGQRAQQVLRLRAADVDLKAGTVLLFDPKGKRTAPRPHLLPLIGEAKQIVERLLQERQARIARAKEENRTLREPDLLFAPTDRPTDATSLSGAVGDICKAMLAADPPEASGPFSMRDVRRTAETKLAQLGIGKEVRAHLLSHGIFGIQDQAYNRYEFAPEKNAALTTWLAELARIEGGEPKASNVIQMPGRLA